MKPYADKYVTAEHAVKQIPNGSRVVIAHATGEPQALTRAFSDNIANYKNVETVHMVGKGESRYCAPEAEGHTRHHSIFVGNNERKAIMEGRGDFTPRYFSRIPALFVDGSMPVDVAMVQVSPPDKHGYVSFGISVDYTLPAARAAKMVIAQVNPQMPRTLGNSFMHVSEIDYLVEVDEPLIELQSGELGDVERAIGKNCSDLIDDGATLQLGIGSLPDAVLLGLKNKKDLGIHTEMFAEGVLDLVEAGVITGARKTLHPGKLVSTFLMGTRRLYDFVDDNPMVMMDTVDYTNDPYIIAKNDKMVSINSAVQIDLMGQVASESVGLMQISGVGGQVDFVRGASMSKGGFSIIAIPSTARKGTVSKIVPFLDEGSAVTTGRNDVMFVATEYGAVNLQGKNLRQRAKALIDIAHPDFQASLTEEWERRFHQTWPGV